MLTRLMPDQISEHWDLISPAIERSLPPIASGSHDRMNKILMSLLGSKSQCWMSYEIEGDGKRRVEGVMVTRIINDYISDCRSLLIYSLYSFAKIDRRTWIAGLKAITKYAISRDCDNIIAYTAVPFLIEMAKKLGGDTRYTFVSIPINRED